MLYTTDRMNLCKLEENGRDMSSSSFLTKVENLFAT